MGSTPVANPSPPRRWRFSRRVVPLAFLALAVIALVAIGVAVVWPSDGADSEWTAVARVDELAVNDPLAVEGDVYLVLLESGEILALSQIDPHLGCKVPFAPDFEYMGDTGWFRNPCHGETYDLTGVCYFGPCPRGLDRYEVRVRDGDVEVSFARLTEGPDNSARDGREPVTLD
ncbi:MAG: Rieske (2Fe-2S) protein [Planctomycetes bacterium]|nr:Rieske (2Fe-2S) protein [Planctomycetota bacterium]